VFSAASHADALRFMSATRPLEWPTVEDAHHDSKSASSSEQIDLRHQMVAAAELEHNKHVWGQKNCFQK
jgi:hypothetical protein